MCCLVRLTFEFLLQVEVLLEDAILLLLFQQGLALPGLFKFLRLETGRLLLVSDISVQTLLDRGCPLLADGFLGVLLASDLDLHSFLGFFRLLNFLRDLLGPFLALCVRKLLFLLLEFRKLRYFLLLLNHFVHALQLKLFSGARPRAHIDAFDFINPLVEVLSLSLQVLVLPVFRAVLTNLEFDLERVERLHD